MSILNLSLFVFFNSQFNFFAKISIIIFECKLLFYLSEVIIHK